MTNEEAIIDIRENIQPIVGGKSLDIAISAIEKQIPKKPVVKKIGDDIKLNYCPCCNVRFFRSGFKYCGECGQRLEWIDWSRRMTDNEIIKKLNYYAKQMDDGYRTHLEHGGKKDDALENDYDALCSALDLIKRQKADIERLEKEAEDKERAYNEEFCLRKEWQTKCRELIKALDKANGGD